MYFTTDILVHTFVTYYDIQAAGPTLVDFIFKSNLKGTSDKHKRNIQYGLFLKSKNIETYIPYVLKTFCKLLCLKYNGVLYTVDSVVCSRDITTSSIVKMSCFSFREIWHADLLIIHKLKKAYIAFTNNNQVVIKGDELPIGVLQKLRHILHTCSRDNWLLVFKKSFLKYTPDLFITNKGNLYTTEGVLCVRIPELFKNKQINYQLYWRKLLPYIQSIQLYYF